MGARGNGGVASNFLNFTGIDFVVSNRNHRIGRNKPDARNGCIVSAWIDFDELTNHFFIYIKIAVCIKYVVIASGTVFYENVASGINIRGIVVPQYGLGLTAA